MTINPFYTTSVLDPSSLTGTNIKVDALSVEALSNLRVYRPPNHSERPHVGPLTLCTPPAPLHRR
jgi:hypothetical protein